MSVPGHAGFPIVKRPAVPGRPVLVSIPHYGMETLPEIDPQHYARPEYASFPLGYVDRFAAEIYGDAHHTGATVLATPYSRLFVDVNRRRDDFHDGDEGVHCPRGVVRTHDVHDEALFADPLTTAVVENRLSRYYDPYHSCLQGLLEELTGDHEQVLLIDAHTAGQKGLGQHEVVVGTSRGRTAREPIARRATEIFSEAGFRTGRDVKGYSGGHIVRTYGRARRERVDAVQIEINTSVLMTTTRREIFRSLTRGEAPAMHEKAASRLKRCVQTLITEFTG